mmetsp:Transcript_91493/g.196148  ORF Transcript_91493/g.196148 Transcript_91493/m.196148 type:complete len:211 (-) Transcript_91493:387-1019(-)
MQLHVVLQVAPCTGEGCAHLVPHPRHALGLLLASRTTCLRTLDMVHEKEVATRILEVVLHGTADAPAAAHVGMRRLCAVLRYGAPCMAREARGCLRSATALTSAPVMSMGSGPPRPDDAALVAQCLAAGGGCRRAIAVILHGNPRHAGEAGWRPRFPQAAALAVLWVHLRGAHSDYGQKEGSDNKGRHQPESQGPGGAAAKAAQESLKCI